MKIKILLLFIISTISAHTMAGNSTSEFKQYQKSCTLNDTGGCVKLVESMMLKDRTNKNIQCNGKNFNGNLFVGCKYNRAGYKRQALFVVKNAKIQTVAGGALSLIEHALKHNGYTPSQVGYYYNASLVELMLS